MAERAVRQHCAIGVLPNGNVGQFLDLLHPKSQSLRFGFDHPGDLFVLIPACWHVFLECIDSVREEDAYSYPNSPQHAGANDGSIVGSAGTLSVPDILVSNVRILTVF